MWFYCYGEISHTSAVSERPVHAIQGLQVNRGEPVSSASLCKMRYAKQPEGKMAKEIQEVGNSILPMSEGNAAGGKGVAYGDILERKLSNTQRLI